MKIYWSYAQFPELSEYSSLQKKIIWLNLGQWDYEDKRKSLSCFAPAIIITSFLLGIIIGAFNCSSPEYGGLLGGMIGAMTPMPFCYLIGINTRRKLLQRYMQSKDFSLMPVNEHVQVMLGPFENRVGHLSPVVVAHSGGVDPSVEAVMDLRDHAHLQPVPRFVHLILYLAASDHADRIEFSLEDAESTTGLRISYYAKGTRHEIAPVHGLLFGSVVVVLCNYASTDYYTKGPVKGRIRTKRPNMCWLLESDDLKKHVLLSKA